MSITLVIAEPTWRKTKNLAARLKHAAKLSLERCGAKGSLSILLTDDARLRDLNVTFRAKDKATNVLSFPARANTEAYLGDVAIAYGVTAKEAKAAAKPFADHAVHLAVHGILHLLGYDHETTRDAGRMETLETAILRELGIADPYARKAA